MQSHPPTQTQAHSRSHQSFLSMLRPVRDAITTITTILTSPATHSSLFRILIALFISLLAVIFAVGAYASFYWVYIPQSGLIKEVWLQYGEGKPPYAFVDLREHSEVLASDQLYDVFLDLIVPSSDKNLDLGNFMVKLELLSPKPTNTTLFSISRPASLSLSNSHSHSHSRSNKPTSPHLQRHFPSSSSSSYFSIFSPFKSSSSPPPQVQHISVALLSSQIVQRSGRGRKVGGVLIEVGRRDAYLNGSPPKDWGELQVYSSQLRFTAQFTGLRWFMYQHPITSFLSLTTIFIICELITAMLVWAIIAYRRHVTSTSLDYDLSPFSSSSSSHPRRSSHLFSSPSFGHPSHTSIGTPFATSTSSSGSSSSRKRLAQVDREASQEAEKRMIEAEQILGPRRRTMESDQEEEEEEDNVQEHERNTSFVHTSSISSLTRRHTTGLRTTTAATAIATVAKGQDQQQGLGLLKVKKEENDVVDDNDDDGGVVEKSWENVENFVSVASGTSSSSSSSSNNRTLRKRRVTKREEDDHDHDGDGGGGDDDDDDDKSTIVGSEMTGITGTGTATSA